MLLTFQNSIILVIISPKIYNLIKLLYYLKLIIYIIF